VVIILMDAPLSSGAIICQNSDKSHMVLSEFPILCWLMYIIGATMEAAGDVTNL
jgi:hypothetical protein